MIGLGNEGRIGDAVVELPCSLVGWLEFASSFTQVEAQIYTICNCSLQGVLEQNTKIPLTLMIVSYFGALCEVNVARD
jgi:hypothetical protein